MAMADADFLQVRRRNPSNLNKQPAAPEQYFSEASFHSRYDGRFAQRALAYDEQKNVTKNLVQTYLTSAADLGVETWLTHSALLGWWWGKKVLPWDAAIDVQITEASIHYLASYYNMSSFYYETAEYPDGNNYLLEINPNYVDREDAKGLNSVDARWIDTDTGMFIDIFAVRYDLANPAGEGMLYTKDGQEFLVRSFFAPRV
ncbi:LicD family-domain-containing protein [Coniella lustricola]|uniref:LicD family-domain-containing protein n=1 Tax=Coniella lustricola TaxID=2025994 RepID=A0A2T2ZYY0_9PEZI|nr:LicD family-domain-containing protein [Coniella lustricola]